MPPTQWVETVRVVCGILYRRNSRPCARLGLPRGGHAIADKASARRATTAGARESWLRLTGRPTLPDPQNRHNFGGTRVCTGTISIWAGPHIGIWPFTAVPQAGQTYELLKISEARSRGPTGPTQQELGGSQ